MFKLFLYSFLYYSVPLRNYSEFVILKIDIWLNSIYVWQKQLYFIVLH